MADNLKNNPERREALRIAVEEGWSLNEIRRTTGIDHRTVKRHYPDYAPFPVGGGGVAQEIRNANKVLNRLDNHGNVRARRANAA